MPGITETDDYYEKQSLKAINFAIEQTEGRPVDETRALIHRSYPFGQCKGRPYKIWNRLVLETERNLGLQPRKHAPKVRPAEEHMKQVVDDLFNKCQAEGKSADATMYQLRRSFPLTTGKKGKPYQVWAEQVAAKEIELNANVKKANNNQE